MFFAFIIGTAALVPLSIISGTVTEDIDLANGWKFGLQFFLIGTSSILITIMTVIICKTFGIKRIE
jgi:hypothetical protein